MDPITIHLTITDTRGHQYGALTLDADTISIWDHEKGDEVAKVATWDLAAWVLALLQSR